MIDELERLAINEIREKLIKIEDVFKNNDKIMLNKKEIQQFLNGVKIKSDMLEGVYKVYGEVEGFIGIGIVKDKFLKRDVII